MQAQLCTFMCCRTLAEWMLVEGVARMPLTCALAPERVTKSEQPAEYGLCASLASTISTALAHAPPLDKYRALYELAVAKDDPNKQGSPPRLDCCYVDGSLPKAGAGMHMGGATPLQSNACYEPNHACHAHTWLPAPCVTVQECTSVASGM